MKLGNKIYTYLLLHLLLLTICSHADSIHEKPIVVLTTSYNNIKWLKKNIESILNQKYSNFRVIYVDDFSMDGTADAVEELIANSDIKIPFSLIRNSKRIGSLANIYSAVHSCSDEEIVVSVDGDDWLPHEFVLQTVNSYYANSNIWLTHGTLIEYPNNAVAWSIPVHPIIVRKNLFRTARCPSHLRTFYAWLFKKVRKEDLLFQNEFFSMAWDQAIMFPMIEMAGERHAFIPTITYVYNVSNPINDNKTNPNLQRVLEEYIRAMPPYQRLDTNPLEGFSTSVRPKNLHTTN